MYRVDMNTNDITITRGDSAVLKLALENTDGTTYTPASTDTVEFQGCQGAKVLFTHKVKQGVVTIVPDDTAALKYDTYSYKVVVRKSDGTTINVINGAKLIVESEVTF